MGTATYVVVLCCVSLGGVLGSAPLAVNAEGDAPASQGSYRLPYADGTSVKVFDVHFEVAMADPQKPIDAGGFLLDNEGGKRERNPRFCGVAGGVVAKGATYRAAPC